MRLQPDGVDVEDNGPEVVVGGDADLQSMDIIRDNLPAAQLKWEPSARDDLRRCDARLPVPHRSLTGENDIALPVPSGSGSYAQRPVTVRAKLSGITSRDTWWSASPGRPALEVPILSTPRGCAFVYPMW
jgi:hypothetical protein